MTANTLAVLIDDNDASAGLLSKDLSLAGIQVVRRRSVASALVLLPALEPDIVLTGLPTDLEGRNPVLLLKVASPAPIVVISANHRDVEDLKQLAPGAAAYFSKPFDPQQLGQELRALIARAQRTHHQAMAARNQATEVRLEVHLRRQGLSRGVGEEPGDQLKARGSSNGVRYGLSRREHEVLALVIDGMSDIEIAQRLGVTKNTASKHVMAIREKLDVRSRTEAAVRALREGLVDASSSQ